MKTAIDLLGIHLSKYKDNLNIPIYNLTHSVECAFTLQNVTQAYKIGDVLSAVFSEWEYVRGKSGYVSVPTALAIREILPSSNKEGLFNALRSYSYFATEKEFKILKREDLLDTLLNLPNEPFVFAVTFSSKKHTSYKAKLCQNNECFEIAELDYNPFEAELLRPIPVNAAIEQKLTGIIKYCTYKPPYHQTQFAERCLCPKN